MEWSWRTVLILIALVVIGYILFDGFRRMRRAQAEALRLDVSHNFKFPEGNHNPELPSGGFRVVGKAAAAQDAEPDPLMDAPARKPAPRTADTAPAAKVVLDPLPDFAADADPFDTSAFNSAALAGDELNSGMHDNEPVFSAFDTKPETEAAKPVVEWQDDLGKSRVISKAKADEKRQAPAEKRVKDLVIPQSPLIPKARPVNLDDAVPVLLDVEELGDDENDPTSAKVHPQQPLFDSLEMEQASAPVRPAAKAADKSKEKPAQPQVQQASLPIADDGDDHQDPHLEDEVDDIPSDLVSQPVNFAGPGAESLAARAAPELVLEIHCIAHDPDGFSGKDILFLFNSCDLRFGEKKIFHRFEEPDGAGCIQFSVSQSYEPGIFVPAAMAQQHFRGLSFFMSLPGAKRPMEAYEAMSEMALVVARKLKADLYDGARSALTPQTMAHDRQQIMDFERSQKLAQKKQARR